MLDMLKSRTVWAGIIAFLFQVASFFGVSLGAIDPASVTDAVVNLIAAVSTIAAIVFRVFPRWQPKA